MATLTTRRSRFRYDAVTHDGTFVTGTVRATTRAEARQRLSVHQLIPNGLHDAPGLLTTDLTDDRMGRRELEGFIAQLAVFASSGVALPTALAVIAEETEDRVIRATATDLAERLSAGETLGDAVDAHERVLPTHVRGVLRSADSTGDLTSALTGLHRHLERQAASRRRFATALVYPGVVAVMALATMAILAGFALPRFAVLFTELGASPPLPVRATNRLGSVLSRWWPMLITAVIAAGVAGAWWVRSPRTRDQRDRLLWRIPGLGRLIRLMMAERLCRVLALVMSSGVAIPAAFEVAIEVSHHRVMRDRLTRARMGIVQGEGIMAALDTTGLLTGSVRQVLSVGERTGTLDRQLMVAADLLAADLDRRLHRVTALLEPALIVAVGLVVAGVAISLVTSMYGVVEQLG